MAEISCTKDGNSHTHSSFYELAACVGERPFAVTVTPARPAAKEPAAASTPGASGVVIRDPSAPPTTAQLRYVGSLGGSWRDAKRDTRGNVSALIEVLKNKEISEAFLVPDEDTPLDDDIWEAFPMELAWRKGELDESWASPDPVVEAVRPVSPAGEPARPVMSTKSKVQAMLPLIEKIPAGYYCTDMGDGTPLKFWRVSFPKTGHYAGAMKVQSQHADRLEVDWVKWPSGSVSVYDTRWVEDHLLAILSDHQGCTRRYAKKLNRCCRCRIELTDERSRHYGIGPECEKYMPWIIEIVDLEDAMAKEESKPF